LNLEIRFLRVRSWEKPPQPLLIAAQVIAPLDQSVKGLVTGHLDSAFLRQEVKPILQTLVHLLERQQPNASGGQLGGQRDAI
jgi:hypothetical protein